MLWFNEKGVSYILWKIPQNSKFFKRNFIIQSISLEATIRVVWYDKRIKVHIDNASDYTSTQPHPPTHLYVDTKDRFILFNRDPVEKFWFPDIFIQKAQETRVPIYRIPPVYLRIYETGQMMYSARVNFDVSCPMSFG